MLELANSGGGGSGTGGGGATHQPATVAAAAAGGSGIVVVKELSKACGVWNLRTQFAARKAGTWQNDNTKFLNAGLDYLVVAGGGGGGGHAASNGGWRWCWWLQSYWLRTKSIKRRSLII